MYYFTCMDPMVEGVLVDEGVGKIYHNVPNNLVHNDLENGNDDKENESENDGNASCYLHDLSLDHYPYHLHLYVSQ